VIQWLWRATDEKSLAVWRNPRQWPGCNAGTMARIAYHEGPPNATRRAFVVRLWAASFRSEDGWSASVSKKLSEET
jgi:hypothetical protein